jgi:polysaccharide pyruvyl transferase WcaK-like protein
MTSVPGEVLLITRLRTLNKGNQALSAAWLGLLQQAFPGVPIRVLERRPPHLLQYTLSQLARSRDPYRAFDALTTKLARLAPGPAAVQPPDAAPRIMLDEAIPVPIRFPELRKRLVLRGWIARVGGYRHAYLQRLAACQRAQLVVVNPAGEFYPREPEPALYHLLDADVARKLGVPTAIVNHTMDIEDATLRAIIPKVYRELDLVGFRDTTSVQPFRDMGGDLGNVVVAPDLALANRPAAKLPRRPGEVAVAINVPEATNRGYAGRWFDVIRGLQAGGHRVVLVSNEAPSDRAFYEQLKKQCGVSIEGAALDYDRYAALLGSFDLVVTSRMHTAILAMAGGAPVVPVEGASFKITGLFQELGLPVQVIRPTADGWVEAVVTQADEVRSCRDALAADLTAKIDAVRSRIADAMLPKLRAAAGIAP